jgi:methionyl-tRNA formyltransferase
LHYNNEGVDSGDVIAFASTAITNKDTGATLSKRLSEAAFQIFRDNLEAIMTGTAPRQKQDLSKGNYLWSGRDWHRINWSRSARGIRGQIRCFTDTSRNAYTFVAGRNLTINDAQIANPDDWRKLKKDVAPGEVIALTGKGPLVQTGKGLLILTDFAVEGEKIDRLRALVEVGMPVLLG